MIAAALLSVGLLAVGLLLYLPFFLHFRPDFLIDSEKELGVPRTEEPITAHNYLEQRLREIKLV